MMTSNACVLTIENGVSRTGGGVAVMAAERSEAQRREADVGGTDFRRKLGGTHGP